VEPNPLTLFAFNAPAIELVLQGTAIYLLLFVLFRFVARREVIPFGIAELLVLVLIANASQSAMTGEHTTLSEDAILVGTVLAWHLLFRLTLTMRYRFIRRLRRARCGDADPRQAQSAPRSMTSS
jgi:uncharacterized membrane protein YcaP (DUF421 family)